MSRAFHANQKGKFKPDGFKSPNRVKRRKAKRIADLKKVKLKKQDEFWVVGQEKERGIKGMMQQLEENGRPYNGMLSPEEIEGLFKHFGKMGFGEMARELTPDELLDPDAEFQEIGEEYFEHIEI